jgi:hypothetical protein
MTRAIVLLLATLASGCATGPTPEQIAAVDEAVCQAQGAARGSQEYEQCRKAEDQQRQQKPPARRPINCTSVPAGNTMTTTCY